MEKVFTGASTTDEVLEGVDLSGKRILVTGVSAGLGVETARSLVAHGAQVVGTARDLAKARTATQHIAAEARNGGSLELVDLDLTSLASVRACAAALLAEGKPFDVVIANAGIMATPQGKTADGFESQLGVNYVGHFVLVNHLVPLLKSGSRVVILSSQGHRNGDVDLQDPNFEHTPYDEFIAYGRSKTACSLLAIEFDRRHQAQGIRSTAVHPGAIPTELGRSMSPETIETVMKMMAEANVLTGRPAVDLKTIPQGAATSVWAGVVAPADLVGGRFCEDCNVAAHSDNVKAHEGVLAYAIDPARAKALWTATEQWVGEKF